MMRIVAIALLVGSCSSTVSVDRAAVDRYVAQYNAAHPPGPRQATLQDLRDCPKSILWDEAALRAWLKARGLAL